MPTPVTSQNPMPTQGTVKVTKGTIIGFVSWDESREKENDIRTSLNINATIPGANIFDLQGNVVDFEKVIVGKTHIDDDSLKCKNGVCTQAYKITGLNPDVAKIGTQPVADKTDVTVAAFALDGDVAADRVIKWNAKEGKVVNLKLE